jgi:hypothetical protein
MSTIELAASAIHKLAEINRRPPGDGDANYDRAAIEKVRDFLEHVGLGAEYVISTWFKHSNQDKTWRTCISTMYSLEIAHPGSVKFLHTRFGITNFSVLGRRFYERMYLERDSARPSMLVLFPSSLGDDITPDRSVYDALQRRLDKLDPPHIVRALEIDSKTSLLRMLFRMTRTYNRQGDNPIKAVIYDGHGLEHRITISNTSSAKNLTVTDIKDLRFLEIILKYLPHAFDSKCEFIFGSCLAASRLKGQQSEPIAEALKHLFEKLFGKSVRIYASKRTISRFTDLNPTTTASGSLHIRTEFAYKGDKDWNPVKRI